MKQNALFLFLSFLIACSPVMGQGSWELKKEKDSIRVYNRNSVHSKFNDLRVETILNTSLSGLAAVILDIPNYPNWSFNSKTAYVLKSISPSEIYFYSEINSPWPANNRDLIIHLHITQDAGSKVMKITADEIPNFIPAKKDIVRVPSSREVWKVTPLDRMRVKIEYELELDPGASVPAWLINTFSVKGPYETFKNLREQVKVPKYRNAVLPFISN